MSGTLRDNGQRNTLNTGSLEFGIELLQSAVLDARAYGFSSALSALLRSLRQKLSTIEQ